METAELIQLTTEKVITESDETRWPNMSSQTSGLGRSEAESLT